MGSLPEGLILQFYRKTNQNLFLFFFFHKAISVIVIL